MRIIGNGRDTSFWFDPWHPWGILYKKFPELKRKLSIRLDARVSDVIRNGNWNLPYGRGWDSQVIAFSRACQGIRISNSSDHWKWTPSSQFSISSATAACLPTQSALPWTKIVWSRRHLPRFAVILWMAFRQRLPTLDKLYHWGIADNNNCLLCGLLRENTYHLFFSCPFSRSVWSATLSKIQCQTITFFWNLIPDWLLTTHWNSNFQKELIFQAVATTVYCLWKERNNRFHTSIKRNPDTITCEILQCLRYCVTSWKNIRKTHKNWSIAVTLGIPMCIFTN